MLPKKLKIAFAGLLLLGSQSQAQLTIQSGATFSMQTGAQVTVQGNVDNAGTLTNDGSLRVQGNYSNTGTYNGVGVAGVLEMYGTGNANLSPGSSTIPNLLINKGAADIVTLTASTTVSNGFTLTDGILTTNPTGTPSVALISPAATPFSFAAGKEVIGSVRRTGWANGTARVFNQPNMLVTTNTGTAPTDFTVTMIPNGDPTQTEREVKRKFVFAYTGGTGFTADVRYPYLTSELNTNDELNLVPWRLVTAEWNSRTIDITRNTGSDWVNTTGITPAELVQEWKLADPNYTMNVTAFMRGAWNNPTGLMRTTINSSGLLPLNQPYSVPPYNYLGSESVGAIPNANVVDWILLELRKPSSGLPGDAISSTVIGKQAAFLLSNGAIVGLNGVTPAQLVISKQGSGNFIVLRHRNHLAAMSIVKASNVVGDFTNDFSVLANVYEKALANSQPVTVLASTAPGNTKYGFWPGDVNANGSITTGDLTQVNVAIAGPASGNLNIYNRQDVNLDRNVTTGDLSVANVSIAASAATSSSRTNNTITSPTPNQLPKPKISHVPGEVVE